MTALCPGNGPSQPIPGAPAVVTFIGETLAVLIVARLGPWGAPLAGVIAALTVNVIASCAVDPPADPNMQQADWAALFSTDPILEPPAAEKFRQLLNRLAWFQLCQCVQNPQPTPPAVLPSPPAGWPGINDPSVTGPRQGSPCWDHVLQGTPSAVGGTFWFVAPPGKFCTQICQYLEAAALTPSSLQFSVTYLPGGDATTQFAARMQWTDINGAALRTDQAPLVGPGGTSTLTPTPPAGWAFASILIEGNGVGNGGPCQGELKLWCAGAPATSPSAPCGPTDPVTQQLLNTILQLVTIIQRQDAPFAYLRGAQHANLSGTGRIAVSGLIGCVVTPTTLPASYGTAVGTPTELFNVGWINWGTPDGYDHREWIGPNPLVSTPCRSGLFTFIGFTLSPGVVVTITELVREP